MEPRDQHPQQTQQSKDKKGVVEPQPATCVDFHPNECSDERVFGCKAGCRHKAVTGAFGPHPPPPSAREERGRIFPLLLFGALLLGLLLTGCLPDPRRLQAADLLDRLVVARAMFGEQPPRVVEACNEVGDVQNRLYGEPGLAEVRPAWPALRAAGGALQSICGRGTLLAQPSNGSQALSRARDRWQQGIDAESRLACEYLRSAAAALGRAAPC